MRDSENYEKLPSPARESTRQIDEIKNEKSSENASKNRSPRGNQPREVFPEKTQESNQLPSDRQLPSDVASRSGSSTEFQWGELVIFNSTTAGIIIDHVGDSYKVLDTRNYVHDNIKDLKRPNPELKYHAFDCNGEKIKCKNIVKILQGRYRDKCGYVLNIYKNYVYLFSHEIRTNEVIVVMEANHLELVNGKHKITSPSDMSDPLNSIPNIESLSITFGTVMEIGANQAVSSGNECGRDSDTSNTVDSLTSQGSSSASTLNSILDILPINDEPFIPDQSVIRERSADIPALSEIINFSCTTNDSDSSSDNSSRGSQKAENSSWLTTGNTCRSRTKTESHEPLERSLKFIFRDYTPSVGLITTHVETSQCNKEPIMTTSPTQPQNPTPPDIDENPLAAESQQLAPEFCPTNNEWQRSGTIVHIKNSYKNEDLSGKTAVICSTSERWCTIRLNKNNRVVYVERSALERVVPVQGDRVRITKGQGGGFVGKVLNFNDETELYVVLIESQIMTITSRKDLCKISKET